MPSTKSRPKPKPDYQLRFEAIGTVWEIEFYGPVAVGQASTKQLESTIRHRIDEYDRIYSRFRPDSLVAGISRQAGTYRLPDDARDLLELYRRLYDLSDGEVTPLIGNSLAQAGYDASYSLRPGQIASPPAWQDVLTYDFPDLTVSQPALLDFGAAGKGHLVDIVAGIIRQAGIRNFCVDAGGDIAVCGDIVQTIGLEHPDDPSRVIGTADIGNRSLCGSAGNRRAWAGFNHILSPSRLQSPDHLKAVWTVAGTTLLADGLATALYFADASILRQHYHFEYLVVYADYSCMVSDNFPGNIF